MNKTTYLMNPHTGSVDTEENWRAEIQESDFGTLIEVVLADGSDVPADFNPAESSNYEWVEA
jgi:hypothetical protein